MERIHLSPTYESARLIMRRQDLAWADQMFACIDQDRARLGEFLPWVPSTKAQSDTEDYIRKATDWWDEQSMFDFSMFEKSSGRYMGNFGVHHIVWENDCCELGYWISSQFLGKGYVTEAVSLIESALFKIGFNRIEIRCDSRNIKSQSIPQRSGYKFEGTLREAQRTTSGFVDLMIFAKLRSDRA